MSELDNRSPCYCCPSRQQPLCELCARYQPLLPDDPARRRRIVLLDASTVARPGACPMSVPRTVAAGMCAG